MFLKIIKKKTTMTCDDSIFTIEVYKSVNTSLTFYYFFYNVHSSFEKNIFACIKTTMNYFTDKYFH